jgi:hypothetical protein
MIIYIGTRLKYQISLFIPNDFICSSFDVIWYFRRHNAKTKSIPNGGPARKYLVNRISGANFGNLLHRSFEANFGSKLSANHNRSNKPPPPQNDNDKKCTMVTLDVHFASHKGFPLLAITLHHYFTYITIDITFYETKRTRIT